MAEVDVTVKGGLLVTVEYETEFEDGECGYPGHYVTEWSIVAIAGKPKKNTDWLTDRLSKADEDRITEACQQHANDAREFDYE